jgi:carbonic anhydrase/acetyltransferase-like protein (isoleucine patch superfamily)
MVVEHQGIRPAIDGQAFIAPTAVLIGDVGIGEGSSVWYNTVIRGARPAIRIGRNTNIQDNCTVHSDPPYTVFIGDNVSVGHNSVIHGATVEDDCLIGMGAVVMNGAVVKKGSIVASGSVVRQGQVIGPYQLVAGVPASLKKELGVQDALENLDNAMIYVKLARIYMGR